MLTITGVGVCLRVLLDDGGAKYGGVAIVPSGLFWAGRVRVVVGASMREESGWLVPDMYMPQSDVGVDRMGYDLVWARPGNEAVLLHYDDREKADEAAKVLANWLIGRVTAEKWWQKRVVWKKGLALVAAGALVGAGVLAGAVWSQKADSEDVLNKLNARIIAGRNRIPQEAGTDRAALPEAAAQGGGGQQYKAAAGTNGLSQEQLVEAARERIRDTLARQNTQRWQAAAPKAGGGGDGFVELSE